MPKNKKKQKCRPSTVLEDDDDSSVSSDFSSPCLNSEDSIPIESDIYEENVRKAIDLATEKCTETRTNALISLKTALQKRVLTGFVGDNYYQTLCSIIEKSIKKGRSLERVAAAKLASVLIVTLSGTNEVEEAFSVFQPIFSNALQDPAISSNARQEIGLTLALMVFLSSPEPAYLSSTLNTLHNIFCLALPKGNGELPTLSPPLKNFYIGALQGVCLLLTVIPSATVCDMASKLLEELKPMLKSSDTDMRITVGEAFALVYEISRNQSEEFRWKHHGELLSQLEDMISESHKYVAKKDRQAQRFSFREIIQSIRNGEPFSETVFIGPSHHQQPLILSNWCLRIQYQALCRSLELGLNVHMMYNIALRNLFDLGPPPPEPYQLKGRVNSTRTKKLQHQTPEVKDRHITRKKNRDNRAAALQYDD